jgi:hypothetical protein
VAAAAASPVSEIISSNFNSHSSDYFPLITKSSSPQSPTNSGKKGVKKDNGSSSSSAAAVLYYHLLAGLTPLRWQHHSLLHTQQW